MSLTERELELAELVARDLPTKDIAPLLGLTYGTTKQYLHLLYQKLGVRGRTGVTAWWFRRVAPGTAGAVESKEVL